MLLSIPEFIGRFHPLLVHLPIGILLLALLLQFLSARPQFAIAPAVMKVVWLLGIFSALLSCITGYLLSLGGEYDKSAVNLHMWMGIGVTAVAMLAGARVFARRPDLVYKAAAIALLLLITLTGHFGGSLTHGADYLTAALRSDNNSGPGAPQKVIADIQAADVYTDVISPVLQSRCYSCHGPQKQKGGLRLDTREGLVKGGKEGKALEPGKPEASALLKRILLPREHEDHMPPKEKPQLTEAQVALIHWWIAQGAPFDKKVQALAQSEKIKPHLLALQGPAAAPEKKAPSTVPEGEVEPASAKALQALRDKGVLVMPVAQGSNYLFANFINAPAFEDKDASLLLPLQKQLVWLKMGGTRAGDIALAAIGKCRQLTVLHLNNTGVTDAGLAQLKDLSALQLLNLRGTAVTAKGVQQLAGLKRLQSLYLYQTGVKAADWAGLKKILPGALLDSGGYVVPLLETDTVVLTRK